VFRSPHRHRHAIELLFGGCVALIGVTVAHNSGGNNPIRTFPGTEAAPMNTTVSDGKFSFRVTAVQRAASTGASRARGEYVLVTMTVANTGDEQQTFFSNNQKLIDAQGRKYEADAMHREASGWSS
jgi:hypothetical protein